MSLKQSRKRPFGVLAIIVLKIATALSLIANIIALTVTDGGRFLNGWWISNDIATSLNSDNLTFMIALTLSLVIVAWHLTLIIGLWLLKRWAWFWVMIQLGLSMALCLWLYFQGERLYVYMWLNTIMVFYLNHREVQYAFGHKRDPQREIV